METEKERQSMKQIEHEFHEHPLVFVGELSNQSRKVYCTGCGEVASGPCFSCSKCEYHLHKKCAQAPKQLKHPLHPRHYRGLFLREGPSVCAFCKEKSDMFFYECHNCWFALDINCALSSNNLAEYFHEFQHDAHRHSLTCIENLRYELTRVPCSFCHQPLVDAVYICLKCPFHLHKKCLDELPIETNHPSHRIHPLFLNNTTTLFCKFCQKKQYGSFYHCSPCNFSINIECAWPKPIIVGDKYHQHPFTLLLRQDSFICDACSIEGNFISYTCSACNIMVHKDCILLPRIIKVTRHDHAIFHNYFLQKQVPGKQDCNICFNEVKVERGSYYCLKQDCNFIVHVNCALENDDLYCVIDQEDQDEELNENLANKEESSITYVIEVNENGELRKIKHFSHEHTLTLGNKIKEDDDKLCDGCMLSISTSFYSCSQCEFLLHKTCAELPRKKHHWFHGSVFTLDCKGIVFKCGFCDRLCSGFLYGSDHSTDGYRYIFCLRCATIPKVLKCDRHKHFLFYDYKHKGQCSACGVLRADGAYRCRECNFVLDFACMTLPNTVQHKCDDHLLKLSYLEENNDIEQHYCDICEEKRDPNLWYYHCATCDNSTHPKCALGKYPFIKDGITWPYWHSHRHDLIFVKNIDDDDYSSACYYCRKICQDQAFKCFTCSNYFRHLECL